MDRMVKTVFNDNLYSPIINENWVPAVDIKEDNISFVLTADIPGLSKSDIDQLVEDNMLKISSSRDTNNENDNGEYHYIPSTVDEENISASFRNGILTVVLPKTEEVHPKQRSIKIK